MDDRRLCPCLKKNGALFSCPLDDYVNLIGCMSYGLHFYPHNHLEETLYACCQDAFPTRIIKGQAFTCQNEDKRPPAIGNLITSTPCTTGPYNDEHMKFNEGNQAGGLTIYKGHLPSDQFSLNNSKKGPNVNQNFNVLESRKASFIAFLRYCRDRRWTLGRPLLPGSPHQARD